MEEKEQYCANYERDNTGFNDFMSKVLKSDNIDPIVENVRKKLLDRSNVGIKKYGTTLKTNTKDNYLNHLQMELMDGCNYIETLLQQKKDITQIIQDTSSDMELGAKIRKIYGE